MRFSYPVGLAVCFCLAAIAFVVSPSKSTPMQAPGLLNSVAVIGPQDNRMTYEEYASKNFGGNLDALYEKFGAAGAFVCNGHAESASIVGRRDVVVTAGHAVYETDEEGRCRPAKNLAACYFQVVSRNGTWDGRQIRILPASLHVSRDYQCDDNKFSIDWAVVRLAKSVTEAAPFESYDVNLVGSVHDGFLKLHGSKIIALAANNGNWQGHSRGVSSICEDRLGYVWPMHTGHGDTYGSWTFAIGIGCSTGLGNSGGAILRNELQPSFLGLISAGSPPDRDHTPFDQHNFAGGPLLQGELYDTLMSVTRE